MSEKPKKAAKTRTVTSKKVATKPAKEKQIPAPAQIEETPPMAPQELEQRQMLDKSPLDEEARIQCCVTLLQQMPPQYMTADKIKENIWAIARFVPTDDMLEKARNSISNPRPRFPQ